MNRRHMIYLIRYNNFNFDALKVSFKIDLFCYSLINTLLCALGAHVVCYSYLIVTNDMVHL